MKIILFDQWGKLVAISKSMAGKAATEKSQYAINRVMPVEGRALMMDRAMNNISVSNESALATAGGQEGVAARAVVSLAKLHGRWVFLRLHRLCLSNSTEWT